MLFTLIFLGLLMAGWTVAASVPWLVASIATRGRAGCLMGLFCVAAGNAGAMTVPIIGFDGAGGLWSSFVVAAVVPALLLAARRFGYGQAPATEREALVDRRER